MKGCVIALVILALIVGAVAGNAVYVHFVTNTLSESLRTLPEEPVTDTTPAAVAAIRQDFKDHVPLLSVTINYTVLDRVTESLLLLESYARTGARFEYAATLTLLHELTEEIARLEKVAAVNILFCGAGFKENNRAGMLKCP